MARRLERAQEYIAAAGATLGGELGAVWARVKAAEAAVLAAWPTSTVRARTAAVAALTRTVRAAMADARQQLRVGYPPVLTGSWGAGVEHALDDLTASGLTSGAITRPMASALVRGDLSDLLTATRFVEETTKNLIRELVEQHLADKLLHGRTAVAAARSLTAEMAGRGIAAVVYADGSRHGLAEYAQMVIRTRSAQLYADASLSTYAAAGITYVELLDNPACGLDSHDGIPKANGMVVKLEFAQAHTLSHPNCVRATTARPDVGNAQQATDANLRGGSTTPAQDAVQAGVAADRERAAANRASRRSLQSRTARSGGRLAPATGQVRSASEARHVQSAAAEPGAKARFRRRRGSA